MADIAKEGKISDIWALQEAEVSGYCGRRDTDENSWLGHVQWMQVESSTSRPAPSFPDPQTGQMDLAVEWIPVEVDDVDEGW